MNTFAVAAKAGFFVNTFAVAAKDGFGSDTDEIEFECHLLPHFNSDTNADTNILEYEYKTDTSDSDSHSDIYSIQRETNIAKFDRDK